MSSSLFSDPDFTARFHSKTPQTMEFLTQAPGSGTYNQRVYDDGRSQRALPHAAISQAMAEKSRVGQQLQQSAMSTTGTFMNKPHMDVEFNRNYEVEKKQTASLFGTIKDALDNSGSSYLPAWVTSEPVVIGMILVIGYFVIFKSK